MGANPYRGEVPIRLAGRDFVMRPSFEVMVAIERQTGKSVQQLLLDLSNNRTSIHDVSVIITEGLKGAGEPANLKSVGEMVFNAGLLTDAVCFPTTMMLYNHLTAGAELEDDPPPGKDEPAKAKPESTIAG